MIIKAVASILTALFVGAGAYCLIMGWIDRAIYFQVGAIFFYLVSIDDENKN